MTASIIHGYRSGRDFEQGEPIKDFNVEHYQAIAKLGINVDEILRTKFAMDSLQPLVTVASVPTLLQFLQNFLPGLVYTTTAALKIDEIIGIQITGAWEDEQVVQGILERTGNAVPYGDWTNVPLESWNLNYETRTMVRFEGGLKVGRLEAARSGRAGVDSGGVKRQSAARSLDIERNTIGFYGYNDGANRTFGFLNDPGLNAYTIVATGAASSTLWSTKTFLEIQKDLITAFVALRTQTQDTVDPGSTKLTLALATAARDRLVTATNFGISVMDWLNKAYPGVRVVSAPQLNNAHSNLNVFYLFADNVEEDGSTDGGQTWIQPVGSRFLVLGVQQLAKAYEESYSNATSGAMCKRPYAVVRYYGI